MSVKVLLPNAFKKHTNGEGEIESSAAHLPELITDIETHFPALRTHLRDEDGKVRPLYQLLCERRRYSFSWQ